MVLMSRIAMTPLLSVIVAMIRLNSGVVMTYSYFVVAIDNEYSIQLRNLPTVL